MNKKISDYLSKKSTNAYLLVFVFLFSIFFISVYTPFQHTTWFKTDNNSQNFLISVVVISCAVVVLVISRIILYLVNRRERLSILAYVFWLITEIFTIAILYTLITKFALKDPRGANDIFRLAIIFVPAILFIPYVVSYLFVGIKMKENTIRTLMEKQKEDFEKLRKTHDDTINFEDERGRLRLSIKASDIFYLEANDNYVNIYYVNNDKVGYTMLRNKLKSLETTMALYGFVRCHRSYMVNLHKIKMIMRERDGFYIIFDATTVGKIPMSKTYSDEVMRQFTM